MAEETADRAAVAIESGRAAAPLPGTRADVRAVAAAVRQLARAVDDRAVDDRAVDDPLAVDGRAALGGRALRGRPVDEPGGAEREIGIVQNGVSGRSGTTGGDGRHQTFDLLD